MGLPARGGIPRGSPRDAENLSFPCPFALVQGVQSFSPFSWKAGFLHEPQVLPPKEMSVGPGKRHFLSG